jgi:pseudouridine kinase
MIETRFARQSKESPVLVIGAAGLDMVGRLRANASSFQFQAGMSNPADIRFSFGGVGRNVAENLARLGQPVRLLTAVGSDRIGQEMLADAADCGVEVSSCIKSEAFPTSSYLAVLDSEGGRYLALEDMAVLDELTPVFIRAKKDLIAQSSFVFFDANLSPKTIKAVISHASRAHIPLCADTASVLLAERLIPHLGSLAMVSANQAEASVLCHNDPLVTDEETALKAARNLINAGVELAIIALGDLGVVYATSEINGHVPALRTQVLDPVGAGDAMIATILFGLLNQIPIDEAVRLGVTAASLILRHRGTVLPYLSLERLYDELIV